MLTQIKYLIGKYPKISAVFGILLMVAVVSSMASDPPSQEKVQRAEGEPMDDYPVEKTFDSSKCTVYTVGTVSGAIMHKFKTTDNAFAFVMVTNRDEVVRIFESKNLNVWKSRENFQNTEYAELVKVLSPSGIQELNRLLSIYPYVAMGVEAFTQVASPFGDQNQCKVD